MVVAPIERRGNWAAMFGVFRHERDGMGDETAQHRVSLLAPHVRRAVAIGQTIGAAAAEAASLSDTLDGLAAGVFLVDAEARLVHANAAGRLMLGTSGAVSAGHDGSLRIERTNLRRLLPGADATAPTISTDSLAIEAADGTRYVAHVLPLGDGARRLAGARYDAVAALFVRPAGFEPKSVPAAIAKAFDLTPSELRVVLSTVHHDGVADIAEALGIGEATVRTHLHRVFGKTETKRQADLVKLVAGFASPLAAR
jgi:DNA-binding CsgD family transcriptional regulator